MATMSILGLYNWDNTLFNGMILPASIDRDVLVDNILMECGELEILYTNPDFMKEAIGRWSLRRLHAWTKLETVLYEDYDPFINIKRDEVRTITQERNLTGTVKTNAYDDGTGVQRDQTTDTGTVTTTENFHVEGDSAITDAQDVARKEYELRIKYDLYNTIIEEFKEKFCILVY